ncbi:ribbon-helix-helix protein, CopG family [Promineifilum sp.]|uniref:ribbon-helix-helix protein, CopG family n=1 Tax=Promineifilum sp. TaxID=2664178 RepID=UPI0035B003E9
MAIASTPITVELPVSVAERLREEANRQNRPVRDLVRELILERWDNLPPLPPEVEAELEAFHSLSDDVLWLVARSSLTIEEQKELARLNAKIQPLGTAEESRREALLAAYDRTVLRRAQAAVILQSRGYDLSNPAVLSE